MLENSTRDFITLEDFFSGKIDPRVKGYFLMGKPLHMMVISFSYIVVCTFIGPRLMKYRQPYVFRRLMMVYNIAQIIGCTWLFLELGFAGWFNGYNWFCQPLDFSTDEKSMRMIDAFFWYFISKFVDYLDTFFIIASKRDQNMSFLHVYHHAIMPFFAWCIASLTPVGHITFIAFLNTFVHVVMYTYYFIAAMGPEYQKYVFWKKYLTVLQISQFVFLFVHCCFLVTNPNCNFPVYVAYWVIFLTITFFTLFVDFYIKDDEKREETRQQQINSNKIK